jgi:hypothetical protein
MLRKFLQDATASMGAAFALMLPTLFVVSMAVTQTTSLVGFQTRLHQSEAAADIFVAKQTNIGGQKQELKNILLDANMALTGGERVESEIINPDDPDNMITTVTYEPDNFVSNIIGNVFEKYEPSETVTVERFRYPIEVVVVFDVSSSAFGFSPAAQIIAGTLGGFNDLFGDDIVSDDTRVSLITYNYGITFTTKHARNLVKPSSRMLYRGTTAAELASYEKRKAMLAEWGLGEDLLADGAPGTEVHFHTLLRKPLVPGTTINQKQTGVATDADYLRYGQHADDPIENLENDGFELAVADGRNFTNTLYLNSDYTATTGRGTWDTVLKVNRDRCILTGCPRDSDLYKYILVPRTKVNETIRHLISPDNYTQFTNFVNSLPVDEFIAASGLATGIMPTLAGSNDKNEIINHMKYYNSRLTRMQMGTAPDEGMIWAYRLLSPNYSKVWDVSEDFPAPYHSTTEKRVIFYAGFPSSGYVSSGEFRALKAMCDSMIEDGIEIYMLGESGDLGGTLGNAYKACTQPEKYPDRVLQYTAATATATWMKAFTRQYHVRLKKS